METNTRPAKKSKKPPVARPEPVPVEPRTQLYAVFLTYGKGYGQNREIRKYMTTRPAFSPEDAVVQLQHSIREQVADCKCWDKHSVLISEQSVADQHARDMEYNALHPAA